MATGGAQGYTPAKQVQPMPAQPAPYATPGGNIYDQSAAAIGQAYGTAGGVANYQPQMINAQGYKPATVAGTNLSAYQNPYQQSVIDTTMTGLNQQQQQAINDVGASASAAGAYGGSRHGVAESLTNDAYAQQQAETLAALNSQGFTNAQQQAQFDVNAQNSAGQFNAGAQNAASLANQSAGLQGAALNLDAANSLGNLSNLGFGQGQAINAAQMEQGTMQQMMQQALIDSAKGQYAGFTGSPQQAVSALMSAMGVPTSTSTTQSYTPGLFDYLTLGVSAMRPPGS